MTSTTTRGRRPAGVTRLERAAKRRRLPHREDTVTTSFALPRTLHERLTLAAVRLNWTFSEAVRTACAEWLARHPEATAGGRP